MLCMWQLKAAECPSVVVYVHLDVIKHIPAGQHMTQQQYEHHLQAKCNRMTSMRLQVSQAASSQPKRGYHIVSLVAVQFEGKPRIGAVDKAPGSDKTSSTAGKCSGALFEWGCWTS